MTDKKKQIDFEKINLNWDLNDNIRWRNIIENMEKFRSVDFNYASLFKNLPSTRKSTSENAIKHLKEAFHNGNLNFVLGAGISSEFGIPTWENLLQRLLMTTIEQETDKAVVLSKFFSKIFNPSHLIAGRYLEDAYRDDKINNKFEKQVRDVLYETFDDNGESLIVDEIVKVLSRSWEQSKS